MKKFLPALVALTSLSLLVGCSDPTGGGVRQCEFYEKSGSKKSETYMLFSGIKVGLWSTWYENGRKESEGQYQDGEREGLWTVWYENGQRDTEGEFRNGEKEGRWTNWYDNGKTKSEGQYQNGEREGRWADWSEDGSINNEKSGIYKAGKRIAPLPEKK